MARLFKRLICVHGALDLFINAPALLGHHCRPRAEYKVIYVSCQVTMARHDLVMPLLTTWRHTNRPTRPCLISWYGEGQWASHSTFISNHNMSHCLSSAVAEPTASTYPDDDVIKWQHFPPCWSFARGIHSVTGGYHSQRPVTRCFDVFYDMRLNKRLRKHSGCQWFETPCCSLWRHYNELHRKPWPSICCAITQSLKWLNRK